MAGKKTSSRNRNQGTDSSLDVVHEGRSAASVKHDSSDAFFIALNEVVEDTTKAVNRGWSATKKFLLTTPVNESNGDIDSVAVVVKQDGSKDAWFLYDFDGSGEAKRNDSASAAFDERTRGTWNSVGESTWNTAGESIETYPEDRNYDSGSYTDDSRFTEPSIQRNRRQNRSHAENDAESVGSFTDKRQEGEEEQRGKRTQRSSPQERTTGSRDQEDQTPNRGSPHESYTERIAREDKLAIQKEKERAARKEKERAARKEKERAARKGKGKEKTTKKGKEKEKAARNKSEKNSEQQHEKKSGTKQDKKKKESGETKKEGDEEWLAKMEKRQSKPEKQNGLWDNFLADTRTESHRSAASGNVATSPAKPSSSTTGKTKLQNGKAAKK